MTAKELIEILKRFPPDIDVVIYDEYDHRWADDEPYIFPDELTKEDMIERGIELPDPRLVLSMCGKCDPV